MVGIMTTVDEYISLLSLMDVSNVQIKGTKKTNAVNESKTYIMILEYSILRFTLRPPGYIIYD
jgi:hypothetical protein